MTSLALAFLAVPALAGIGVLFVLLLAVAPWTGEAARVARKTMVGDTVTTISATTTGTTIYDMRGRCHNLAVRVNVSAITGGDANNYFKLELYGCNTETGTFAPIQGMISDKLNATGGYQFPLSTVTQAIVMPRFVKFVWTETGTITGFTAAAFIDYDDDPTGPGRQYVSGYQGG